MIKSRKDQRLEDPFVAEELHCSLHVKELKVTTTELERQIGS